MSKMNRRKFILGSAAIAGTSLPLSVLAHHNEFHWKGPGGSDPTPTPEPTATPEPPQATATPTPVPDPTATPTATPAPSGGLSRALDTDFGNSGPQEQWWFDSARQAGYEGFITTAHTYWGGNPQPWWATNLVLQRALNAGMWIGAYGRPVSHWQQSLDNISPALRQQLKFFALDVEPEPGQNIPLQREYVTGVQSYGVKPVVYSGFGMWADVMGNDASFSDVPLWEFAGDRDGWPESMWESPIYQFGGWNTSEATLRIGQQLRMQNPVLLNGIWIDDDIFDLSRL